LRSALDSFETVFNRLTVLLALVVAISIGLIAILIPLNLLLIRTHLGSLWWLFEGVEYALFFGVFLSSPWVLQQGAHVRVDVVTSALPREMAAWLERFIDSAGFALCVLLCIYGVRAMVSEYQDGTLPDKDLRIPNWIVLAGFSISFLMLSVEFLLRMRLERVLIPGRQAKSETGL
jgi:TRAP-type C4-dicarboxylate transport system permease small subunit